MLLKKIEVKIIFECLTWTIAIDAVRFLEIEMI